MYLFLIPLLYLFCQAPPKAVEIPKKEVLETEIPAPAGETVLNERREVVIPTTKEISFFQKQSENPSEVFRVFVSSEAYFVRQIRNSPQIQRKEDQAGDELTKEELKRYDVINFIDDGTVSIGLNANSGKLETISFDRRVPRINEVAKIIQNDASRWAYEHSEGKPTITKFTIHYQIRLYPKISKEEAKEQLKKKR